jgi:DNA-damage-inducible protein J
MLSLDKNVRTETRKRFAFVLHMWHNKAMKTSAVHARIEPQTKEKAEEILRSLGLTPTEAIRIFYKQISLRGGLPFPVAIPNKLTASTLEKSRRGEDVQEFESLEVMFDSWKK